MELRDQGSRGAHLGKAIEHVRVWLVGGRGLNFWMILRLFYLLIILKAVALAFDMIFAESHAFLSVSTVKNLYLFPILRYTPNATGINAQHPSIHNAMKQEVKTGISSLDMLSSSVVEQHLSESIPTYQPTVTVTTKEEVDAEQPFKEENAREDEAIAKVLDRPSRPRSNVSFGVCIMLRSAEDLRNFRLGWLPSFVTSLSRKETDKLRFVLYIGVSRANLIRFNLDFLRPKWLNVRPVTDSSQVELLGIAARVTDFVLAVNPNGRFIARYWAMLALRRMNRIEPTGQFYLNLSSVDNNLDGLIVSSRVFNILQLAKHNPIEIASLLKTVYQESPMRGGRKFYVWSTKGRLKRKQEAPTESPPSPHFQATLQRVTSVIDQRAALKYMASRGVDSFGTTHYENFKLAQEAAMTALNSSLSSDLIAANLNLLIVSTVSSKKESVEGFRKIVAHFDAEQKHQLSTFGRKDTVKFLLNFYEERTEFWNQTLKEHQGFILDVVHGMKCKIQLWAALSSRYTKGFDYVWLMDDDLDLTFYKWRLARMILKGLQPFVAAPGIIPLHKRGRSTWWRMTRAQAQVDITSFQLSLARNVDFVEVMAPMISTKFWPLVHDRLRFFNLSGVYCIDCFWSQAANEWAGKRCGLRAPIIVMDITPAIHTDRRTLGKVFSEQIKEGVLKRYAGCVRGPIESNLDLSEFGWDILKPRSFSADYDKSTNKMLKSIQRNGLHCPAHGAYESSALWPAVRI